MKKLRWATDCSGFWDLDVSTPVTLQATARPLPAPLLPLGLSRGVQLARPKQLHFMHNFMSMPFVPSYSPFDQGFSFHRALSLPLGHNWFAALLGQFNLQKFLSDINNMSSDQQSMSSWFKQAGTRLSNTSLYALGFCAEYLITPDCSLLFSSEAHDDPRGVGNSLVLRRRLPRHNLTVEGVWPGLFVDQSGTYWSVPSSVNVDLASDGFDSGLNYHVCIQHNGGTPKRFASDQNNGASPPILQPGLCIKSAFSLKKDADIWRAKSGKLRMVQPYDIFLSDPHVQLSGVIGAAATASIRQGPEKIFESSQSHDFTCMNLCAHAQLQKPAILADFFSSICCTAQHGNFQRLLFDLTRLSVRLDIHSGSTFIKGASHLTQDFFNSRQLSPSAIRAVCPHLNLSFQQQIIGPFSVRADSRITLDLKDNGWYGARVDDSVIALEYALKVLASAKATAWYSIKKREAMVELRFFES